MPSQDMRCVEISFRSSSRPVENIEIGWVGILPPFHLNSNIEKNISCDNPSYNILDTCIFLTLAYTSIDGILLLLFYHVDKIGILMSLCDEIYFIFPSFSVNKQGHKFVVSWMTELMTLLHYEL